MVGGRKVSKYLHRDPEELYDVGSDPNELRNLANSPQHRATLAKMRAEVKDFRIQTQDPWLINDNYR
ncbi:MAG: hypothetical protein WKF37_03905 [Bryobacteraceae bacterium]